MHRPFHRETNPLSLPLKSCFSIEMWPWVFGRSVGRGTPLSWEPWCAWSLLRVAIAADQSNASPETQLNSMLRISVDSFLSVQIRNTALKTVLLPSYRSDRWPICVMMLDRIVFVLNEFEIWLEMGIRRAGNWRVEIACSLMTRTSRNEVKPLQSLCKYSSWLARWKKLRI